MKTTLTYIDLFCGAGGLSYGFDKAGNNNVFAVDIEPTFCKTYKRNFPKHKLIQQDISRLTETEIHNLTKNQKVDVVIGGPPCQGFSMAGNIGRKFIDDPRNHLFQEFARIVKIVTPDYFVMENVARLFTHNNGKTRQEIIKFFEELGYNVECKIFNTVDFGIPQSRQRILFIGNRISKNIVFPEKTAQKPKTIKDAIDKFPKLESGESSKIPNHIAMKHSAQMLEKMSYVSDGGNRTEIPENIRPQKGDVRKYIRYKSSEPSVCITGDMRKIFHYSQNRALTVRELSAIQTFPDNFIFEGSSISQQQQVGNSIPPLFAEKIAEAIIKMKENDAQIPQN
ncbi:MAG: DNA (cytosine-5-)-methyltransferase [Dysgonamonadaceae bacterium]|jgi:DNA (cytosine-5)-methyltransferase 1|nr:DNA (cytosine-5-)-methyltransferase [Dysgonamonadaceae bacterium]